MITYTRTITETIQCPICHGEGEIWDTEYHNQPMKRTCYKCRGTRKQIVNKSVDITEEFESMINMINFLTEKLKQCQ